MKKNKKVAKKQQKEQVIPLGESTLPPIIEDEFKLIQSQASTLRRLYRSYKYSHGLWEDVTEHTVLIKYLEYYMELCEQDRFSGKSRPQVSRDQMIGYASEDVLFKSFNFFKGEWEVRFTNKFFSKLREQMTRGLILMLAYMSMLSKGRWPGSSYKTPYPRVRQQSVDYPTAYNAYYSMRIYINRNFLFNVGVERVPIMDKNQRITRYEYTSYIQFFDVLSDNDMIPMNLEPILKKYIAKNLEDPGRNGFSQQLQRDQQYYKRSHHRSDDLLFYEVKNPTLQTLYSVQKRSVNSEEVVAALPTVFKPTYISNAEAASLIYNSQTHRWTTKDAMLRAERIKFNQFQQKINEEILKKYVDFRSAKNLVQLLKKIPNFKIKLTEQEKNVVGENGNVMVIGRSGTGKTTCAVLRLFAIEMLFKIRVSLGKRRFEAILKDTRFVADDIDDTIGLHSLFVTASPVLTNEIQRYYKKLTDQIKQELQKKRKKIEAQRAAEQKEVAEKSVQEVTQNVEVKEQQIGFRQIQSQVKQIKEQKEQKEIADQIEEETHMNEQFSGLEGVQGNVEMEEEEDDLELQQLQNKINKFSSLNDLQETDFPGFFTVRALVMMLDGTLSKPFFIRNQNKQVVGQESKAAWHNEQKGVMMIQNYYKKMNVEGEQQQVVEGAIDEEINYSDEEELEHEYQRQIRLRQQRGKQEFSKKLQSKGNKKLSFQIDFDYFSIHFWPQIKKRYYTSKNISAHLIWTQIYSTIKGSANSHLYPGAYLPEKVYLQKCNNTFLNKDQKLQIYESFCQYERWKTKLCAYDMIDVVNYILTQIRWRGYSGPSIHYLMIDQVQDLPHATLYLLTKIAQQGVFFSGDTAQTIAKGVGFRFCDLKSMFMHKHFDSELKLAKPTVMQLTINFRSHNNILQLANSIISIIQILFPATIDRLKKERSDLKGPKPILLADSDIELLFFVLCGQEAYKKQLQSSQGDLMKRPPLQFGCDQVILVRDQQSKKKLPAVLQHALCLTIYEAKGLQFNDVILFNFFTQSKCSDRWNLIKFLKVTDQSIPLEDYKRTVTQHKKMADEEGGQKVEQETNCVEQTYVGGNVIVKKVKQDSQIGLKDINDYGELCSELKMLYTAVTRPRNTLIIYDEDSTSRKPLQKYWEKVQVAQVISKQIVDLVAEQQTKPKRKLSNSTEEAKIFSSLITKTSTEEWRRQGIKMFKRKYFQQAMKCFQMSHDTDLYNKAKANAIADESTRELIEVEAQKGYIKNKLYTYAQMSRQDITKAKSRLKNIQKKALSNFSVAGQLFMTAEMYKQAGQCFFSGKEFSKAEECFRKIGMTKQVAESLFMQHQYIEAAVAFADSDDYLKAIQCYDSIGDWEKILKTINRFSDKIPEAQKQMFIKKYAALCLQELVQQVEFQNQGGEQSSPVVAKPDLVIDEKSSDQQQDFSDSNQDQDPQIQAEKEWRKKKSEELSRKESEQIARKNSEAEMNSRKNSEMQPAQKFVKQASEKQNEESEVVELKEQESVQQLKVEQVESSIKDPSSEVIQLKQTFNKSKDSESFADLNQPNEQSKDQSWVDLNQPDIEAVKSLADPTDEWIGSALSEIQGKIQSDYSVIEQTNLLTPQARIIKTKGNILVQDSIMQKVINIVSIVNNSIADYLKSLKGHQSLVSNTQIRSNEFQINDFEDIDPQFICKILDTLESFKIYKLCIFVCNRYHLPSKLGRYLASTALKYSTNALNNMTITPSLLAANPHRKSQLEKGVLASIALHAIFENINPEFLKVKVGDKNKKASQTLGEYSVTALLLEGLYKKVVFMVNVEESLSILSNYMETDMYRSVFLNNYFKDAKDMHYLPCEPKSEAQTEYTVLNLQANIWRQLSRMQSELVSSFYTKQVHANEIFVEHQLPSYLKFNKSLWGFLKSSNGKAEAKQLKQNLIELSELFKPLIEGQKVFPPHVIYDVVTFSILIFYFPIVEQELQKLTTYQFTNIYQGVQNLYYLITNLRAGNQNSWWIIRAMLSIYQARIIHGSRTMRIFGDSYIFLYRSSPIINDLIEQRKRELQRHQQKYKGIDKPPKFKEEVFFIQQEFNIIIAPFLKTFKKIRQRILRKLVAFSNLYAKLSALHSASVTMEDFIEQQNRIIFNHFIKDQQVRLRGMIAFLKQKTRKQLKQEAKLQAKAAEALKAKAHKPSIGSRMVSHFHSLEEEEEVQQIDKQQRLVDIDRKLFDSLYLPSKTGHPLLQNYMLTKFQANCSLNKHNITNGKYLFVSGLNKHYRQYTRKQGGYFLFDAFEFKLFNRLDMYAFNLQEVISDLSINDQVFYIEEVLLLLLVHSHSLKQPAFKLELLTDHLKFLQGLSFVQYANKQASYHRNFRQAIASNESCIFSCEYRLSSQQDSKGIRSLIMDYLKLAKTIITNSEYSKNSYVVYWYPILLEYLFNYPEFGKQMFDLLKSMVDQVGEAVQTEHEDQLKKLLNCTNQASVIAWRNKIISGEVKLKDVLLHEVKFKVHSNPKKDVKDSEDDYNRYDVVLGKRIAAARVIKRWWRRINKNRKELTREEINLQVEKKAIEGWPVFLYKLPQDFYPQFLPRTTQLSQILISFYLQNVVTSSLDLHFILMTLGRIEDLRESFIKLATSESVEFETQIEESQELLKDIEKDIQTWQNDEKWSARGQMQLKNKKVFEIKWLTKVAKKRAGLKKQALLAEKKQRIKRTG